MPIAVTYIPVCENSVQIESVSSVDSLVVSKGHDMLSTIDHVLINFMYQSQGVAIH